jgi:hypothetical protein
MPSPLVFILLEHEPPLVVVEDRKRNDSPRNSRIFDLSTWVKENLRANSPIFHESLLGPILALPQFVLELAEHIGYRPTPDTVIEDYLYRDCIGQLTEQDILLFMVNSSTRGPRI